MNDTIEAIRQKFAPALPVDRYARGEALSERRLQRRGIVFPERPARVITDDEQDLERRVRDARHAFSDANGTEGNAWRTLVRLRAESGVLAKALDPNAVDRARRHHERCVNARLLAESELDEILRERSALRRQQKAQEQAAAAAEIAQRDRTRAIRRRAAGLPQLPAPERIVLRSPVHFGGSR